MQDKVRNYTTGFQNIYFEIMLVVMLVNGRKSISIGTMKIKCTQEGKENEGDRHESAV